MWSSVRGFSWKVLRMECCRTPVSCELFDLFSSFLSSFSFDVENVPLYRQHRIS
ncbi:hypothetical protein RchiOBHm_Chr3g0490511 [Rosa chinensis]|uniref:Uncharacterized protein n=1 Tax=Rosa chinensis TaxID=74649 RepID=A0A2P6RG16_ROSCH|nr:hypothetical protein RchiOBHm_Chr3g0490511 [Rosa chinensis]